MKSATANNSQIVWQHSSKYSDPILSTQIHLCTDCASNKRIPLAELNKIISILSLTITIHYTVIVLCSVH